MIIAILDSLKTIIISELRILLILPFSLNLNAFWVFVRCLLLPISKKTAGTTINWILKRSFGINHCDVEPWKQGEEYYSTSYCADDHQRLRRLYPNLASIAGHQVKPHSDLETVCPEIRYFTFLRIPVARMASQYQYLIQRMHYGWSFEEFFGQERFHNVQTKHLAGKDDVALAIKIIDEKKIFIGLVEKFDESLVLMKKIF